ncbi:transposase [Paenibacillus montaniterrae]|uniref:transposase n=1 Tax=Paenibacillus montaniterrae TaxID=429341 RepID=UPI001BCC4E56
MKSAVVCRLSLRGIEDQFPTIVITFDKFHVMKMVNKAVDDMRIAEQKEAPQLRGLLP